MLGGAVLVGLDILKTAVNETTKHVSAMIGDVISARGITQNAEWWQHIGFVSIPAEADGGGKEAAKVILLRLGGHDIVIASRDKRGQELAGNLGPGETTIYAAGKDGKAQGRVIIKGDGSISAYTRKGNSADGDGMILQIDPNADSVRLLNSKGMGIVADPDSVTITAGANAALTLNADGNIQLVGTKTTQVDGSKVVLGNIVAPPVNNVLTGPTGVSGKGSIKVFAE